MLVLWQTFLERCAIRMNHRCVQDICFFSPSPALLMFWTRVLQQQYSCTQKPQGYLLLMSPPIAKAESAISVAKSEFIISQGSCCKSFFFFLSNGIELWEQGKREKERISWGIRGFHVDIVKKRRRAVGGCVFSSKPTVRGVGAWAVFTANFASDSVHSEWELLTNDSSVIRDAVCNCCPDYETMNAVWLLLLFLGKERGTEKLSKDETFCLCCVCLFTWAIVVTGACSVRGTTLLYM